MQQLTETQNKWLQRLDSLALILVGLTGLLMFYEPLALPAGALLVLYMVGSYFFLKAQGVKMPPQEELSAKSFLYRLVPLLLLMYLPRIYNFLLPAGPGQPESIVNVMNQIGCLLLIVFWIAENGSHLMPENWEQRFDLDPDKKEAYIRHRRQRRLWKISIGLLITAVLVVFYRYGIGAGWFPLGKVPSGPSIWALPPQTLRLMSSFIYVGLLVGLPLAALEKLFFREQFETFQDRSAIFRSSIIGAAGLAALGFMIAHEVLRLHG